MNNSPVTVHVVEMDTTRASLRSASDGRGETNPIPLLGGIAIGVITATFGVLQVPGWVNEAKRAEAERNGTTPTPTTTTAQQAVSSAPADLTAIWVTLAIIIGLAVIALIMARVIPAIAGARRRSVYAADARDRQTAAWQLFADRHNCLLRKIAHAETDWDTLFFTPAINDPSVPETLRMLEAMRTAGNLRDTAGTLPAGLAADADITALPYPKAVDAFDLAWDVAEKNARRIGQSATPPHERKMISEIRTLLNIAENAAASGTERGLAYRKAQSLIGELTTIHVPKTALAELEARVAPALEMAR